MSTAQETGNKAIVARLEAAVSSGDWETIATAIDELVAQDALIRSPVPTDATGRQKLKEIFATLHRAYPDLRVELDDLIAEGDRVVACNTVTGTHRGEYMGIPPTGKSVTYNEIFVFRVADGRIAETWGVVDVLSQLRQLGALPGGAS